MRIENGKVILETKPCHCTLYGPGPGKSIRTFPHKDSKTFGYCIKARCPYNKTGKRGETHDYKPAVVVTCGACNGSAILAENYCDTITIPAEMPMFVVRQNRSNSFNENHLGMGCLYSVTDYGEAANMTDENLLAKVRDYEQETQLINLVPSKADLTLCDALAVYVTRDGYSVRPYFKGEGVKQFSVPAETAMALGREIFRQGGNGTLAAAKME